MGGGGKRGQGGGHRKETMGLAYFHNVCATCVRYNCKPLWWWWCTSTLTVLPVFHILKVTVNKFRSKQKLCIWFVYGIFVFLKSKCKSQWLLFLPVLLVLDWALLSSAGIGLAMIVINYLLWELKEITDLNTSVNSRGTMIEWSWQWHSTLTLVTVEIKATNV